MNEMNPKVDQFIQKSNKWQDEYKRLRMIIRDNNLSEDFKWGVPCYTYKNSNVILIHGFKEYCAVLFVKGVLLKDEEHILIQQTENVQSARQIRFSTIEEIVQMENVLKSYITEAIEIEKSGIKVKLKREDELQYPEEFQMLLDNLPDLKVAFNSLTLGRKRAYNLYFSAPKQSKTRQSRIDANLKKILDGKGLND